MGLSEGMGPSTLGQAVFTQGTVSPAYVTVMSLIA